MRVSPSPVCFFQHGRVKTKSSEEQESAKKVEKAKQVREYREVTNRIYDKVFVSL